MRVFRYCCIFGLLLTMRFNASGEGDELEPRMSLPERVSNAKLIVIGKLHPLPGGKHGSCTVEISQVLFGSMPTNKTLLVHYNSSRWLAPEAASRTYTMKRGQPQICFVTDEGQAQSSTGSMRDMYVTRAVDFLGNVGPLESE